VIDPPAPQRRPGLVLAVLALCGTVMSLQQSIVVPVLPVLPGLLDTSPDNASWILTASLLSGAVTTPVVARLADMHGKRLLMTVVLAVMVTGSAVGAFSETLAVAIAARTLQGVGVALVPVAIAAMRDELPPDRVPLGVALMSSTLAIGSAAGLPVAGLIVTHLDWHAVFWVTGAAGTVMLVAVPLVLNPSRVVTRGSFDGPGALLLGGGLSAVLLALTQGAQWGWTSPATLACAAGGVLALVALVPLELRSRHPLVDVRIAKRPAVLLVNVASLLLGFAMFTNLLVSAQLLQLPAATGFGLGLPPAVAGLWLAPSSLALAVTAPVASLLIRRAGAEATLLLGSVCMAAAYAARTVLSHELWQVVAGSVLVVSSVSLTFAAMPVLLIRAVPETETASANGLNHLLRSVGSSGSSAVTAVLMTMGLVAVGGASFPSFDSLVTVLWLAAATSVVAAVAALALVVGNRRAAFHPSRSERVPEPARP